MSMYQQVPDNPTVNLDLFTAEDWEEVPVLHDMGAWSKSVDLRINTGAGEHILVGLTANDDTQDPVADIPSLIDLSPTDLRALASGLERVAALMDQIAMGGAQ